jgi:uncharacterized protein (DUF1015 family)
VGGIRGTGELKRLVDSGKYKVAFSLHPVTIAPLMAEAIKRISSEQSVSSLFN